jgi:hypothetical protein
MIVLAAFTLNILHPSMLLREYDERVERIEVGAIGQDKIASSPSVQTTPEPPPRSTLGRRRKIVIERTALTTVAVPTG